MIKLNMKIRFQSKTFLLSLLALFLTLANQLAALFSVDITLITEEITSVAETVLLILVLVGIVHDPTTKSLSDSDIVMKKERLK